MSKRPLQIKTQAFLANLPMFSDLGSEDLDRIAASTVPLHFEKGQSIVQCGDPCTGFHLVVYGQVKLGFTSPQGVEKVVEIVRPGQSFGEALMFLDKPYIVFAQALADSMLLHVAKHAVLKELSHDPDFARRMLAGLVAPLFTGGALQAQVEIRTAEQKLAVAEYGRVGARAFGEVEGALSTTFTLVERAAILAQSVAENERTLELANVRYRVGSGDLRAVQQQQLAVHVARTALLRVQSEQLVQRVNLHLALGGGWSNQ